MNYYFETMPKSSIISELQKYIANMTSLKFVIRLKVEQRFFSERVLMWLTKLFLFEMNVESQQVACSGTIPEKLQILKNAGKTGTLTIVSLYLKLEPADDCMTSIL